MAIEFTVRRPDSIPEKIPQNSDLFITSAGRLCMVWLHKEETLGLFTGVPYIHLSGHQVGAKDRFYLTSEEFSKQRKVELEQPVRLKEV